MENSKIIINKDEYITYLDKVAMNSVLSYIYDIKILTSDATVYEKLKIFILKHTN